MPGESTRVSFTDFKSVITTSFAAYLNEGGGRRGPAFVQNALGQVLT